jgi:hypothetical protein
LGRSRRSGGRFAFGMLITLRICLGMLRSTGRRVVPKVRLGLVLSPALFRIVRSMRFIVEVILVRVVEADSVNGCG